MSRAVEILQLLNEILDKDSEDSSSVSETEEKKKDTKSGRYQLPLRYQGCKEGK